MFEKIQKNLGNMATGVKNYSTEQAINVALGIVKHASSSQLSTMLKILESISTTENTRKAIQSVRQDFDKKGMWYKLLKKFLKNINPNCRQKLIKNLIIGEMIESQAIKEEFKKRNGFYPPSHIVISPLMRCNLRCIGCYAGAYSKKDDLPRKYFEKAIEEARAMGIKFITISGGEPFAREDILDVFAKYSDVFFQVYTNGTFINKEKAKQLAKLGNVVPAISVEGFEKETDARRGKGIWKKVMQAMDNLYEVGVPFGFSATPTRVNADILIQDKFIDLMIKKHAIFGWFFHYIPIGKNPDLNLMPTPEQRDLLRRTIQHKWRNNKGIFIGDFWNDGPAVGGCMCGGSMYLHINVHGDIEPCVFVQMSVDNIKKTTLEEALKSKLFVHLRDHNQSVRAAHPASENLLTPCMIIDNPEVLRNCVKKCKPRFSYPGGEDIVCSKQTCNFLDNYSKNYHKIADRAWDKEFGKKFYKEKKKLCNNEK